MKKIKINDIKSLVHTTWNANTTLYSYQNQKKAFYENKRLEINQILRQLRKQKEVMVIEAKVCPEHISMLTEIQTKYSVLAFMEFLKGKSYRNIQLLDKYVLSIQKKKILMQRVLFSYTRK